MSDLELTKISLENTLLFLEQKMYKSSQSVNLEDIWSRYIQHEKGRSDCSEVEKNRNLERFRNQLTIYAIKALKIADFILKKINDCIKTLKSNKNAYWYPSLFNKFVEMKSKLNDQIFDAKSLKDKFGNKNMDFKQINLEEDEIEINQCDIIAMGIDFNDYHFSYFPNMKKKYGKADEYNIDIIHNGYTQRCSSFDLNKKLRKGQLLNKNENEIYLAINNACSDNSLKENKYLFRYVSQEFINKYNIEFNRLSQSSISNAIFKFKNNVIDKKIKEKDNGFISSSCDIIKNVFKSRDVLFVLYVEKGCHLYVTNNEAESEIILPPGMIYHFFDCFFIERQLIGEKCHQTVIKTFLKNYY